MRGSGSSSSSSIQRWPPRVGSRMKRKPPRAHESAVVAHGNARENHTAVRKNGKLREILRESGERKAMTG
jgi:hypothetical protein